jgi:hypothetical protein
LRINQPVTKHHKQLKHNKFHDNRRLHERLKQAILPKKLTQIYHNYLKTPHFEAIFFTIFINNDDLTLAV